MGCFNGENLIDKVKKLNIKDLDNLAQDIREEIISTTYENGGHLASNLGIVETTIALYRVFDFPKDKLIFDVGHQCYAHKILSGRAKDFSTIRTHGGLSGFPDITESEYDAFSVGHAGTSMAAGIGYCNARDKKGEDYSVVAVVGDGSVGNGLNLEALSSSNVKPKNFIVILNDNGMSISKNKNGFYQLVSKGTTKRGYLGGKKAITKIFGNSFVTRALAAFRNFIKRVINKNSYFENHGFKYVGVVDGNDIKELVAILERVKRVAKDRAVLVHVKTTKGKGYEKAEANADVYHGVGAHLQNDSGTFSLALGNKLNELIDKDEKVVAITAAMKDGTGLKTVEEKYPENFVDVGIAEEYAVTLAAGMAAGGLKPFVAVYSTFMQRAYDQIVHDVCLQNLPVVFCLDRAGLVGKDGKTHQGVFDLSFLTHVPNMNVFAPNSVEELEDIIDYAIELKAPVAIRYPKNAGVTDAHTSIKKELWRTVKDGTKVTILAVGPNALKVSTEYAKKHDGMGVVSARSIKPLDEKVLDRIKDTAIVTVEENSVIGGFGSMVAGYYNGKGFIVKIKNVGVKDEFVGHGDISDQFEENGITESGIDVAIKQMI
ncbi:MAG: 1-deoxy-D-xylulose-5-phosphate synthase [Clostridia bacterium]|nr:1-deoxy-D-xylulose-5-phosphate synthase [Clostridia bacterium]